MHKKQTVTAVLIVLVAFASGYSAGRIQERTALSALLLQDAILKISSQEKFETKVLGKLTTQSKSRVKSRKAKKPFSKPVEQNETPVTNEGHGAFEPYTAPVTKFKGKSVPKDLLEIVQDTTLQQTVKEITQELNQTIVSGPKLTESQVEDIVKKMFGEAVTDSGLFASDLVQKHNLKQLAATAAQGKNGLKKIEKQVKAELENYAQQEVNKLANQAATYFIPQLSGLNIDYTDLNEKAIKASLRKSAVNALAQSYLGPQYVAFYLTFETFFPHEAEKVHKELRRFDKKYLRPVADDVQDEIGRAVENVQAELKRLGKKVSNEAKRVEKKTKKELKRIKKKLRF